MQLNDDILQCFDWMASKTSDEIIARREAMLRAIELDAVRFINEGITASWLATADEQIKVISQEVNGPLFEMLLCAVDHKDTQCPELFRSGAPLLGRLPVSGNGTMIQKQEHRPIECLRRCAGKNNVALINRIKEDQFADEILAQTQLDIRLGRMTEISPCEQIDLNSICISPRFAVEQGIKPCGKRKIRCVDSCTVSGLNPSTEATERLAPDNLDELFEVMRRFWQASGMIPHLLKVDIASAFRRVPLLPADRWAAYIAFKRKEEVFVAGHLSMPSGASSSVFAWDRVGAAIVRIIRVLSKIPLLRYVDDMFTADWPACVVHSRECVIRLVRAILGASSITDKYCSGLPLDVLGITVSADAYGVSFAPSEDKVNKWCGDIDEALSNHSLGPGMGKKLAGRLSWSAQHSFCRLGRALLRPLFNIDKRSKWSPILESSLKWWREVLSLQIVQVRPWTLPLRRPVVLLCDARGFPARLAAVVYTWDGLSYYTDMVPPRELLDLFTNRRDNQICGLELCAIALGLCTFAEHLEGQKVHVYSDNCGSQHATDRGSAKAWDHTRIVHALWYKAALLRCHMVIDRVGTKENISDLPSRCEYKLMAAMRSHYQRPILDSLFWTEEAWNTVELRRAVQN